MSCDHLKNYDQKQYNACIAQATAFTRSEQTSARQATEAAYAKQADISAIYARGATAATPTPTDYRHASMAHLLPKTAANVAAGSGKGPNMGMMIAGILGGGLVFMGIIFLMLRTKPPRRSGYRGYRP